MGKDELERRVQHFPLVRSLPGFFVTENRPERTHQPVHILLSHKLPIKPFPEILQQQFGIQNQVPAI